MFIANQYDSPLNEGFVQALEMELAFFLRRYMILFGVADSVYSFINL